MKTMLVLLLIALPTQVFARDFRVVNLKANCADIKRLEARSGSRHVGDTVKHNSFRAQTDKGVESGTNILLGMEFKGKYFGIPGKVNYLCVNNRFFSGYYLFESPKQKAAVEQFKRIKASLAKQYGRPVHDGDTEDSRQWFKERGKNYSVESRYRAVWEDDRIQVTHFITKPYGKYPDYLVTVMVRESDCGAWKSCPGTSKK